MPGGVSSPVRSFASVGGEPFFAVSGRGPRSATRTALLPRLCGVVRAPSLRPCSALRSAGAFGGPPRAGPRLARPTELEVRLAERVSGWFPRSSSSGSSAPDGSDALRDATRARGDGPRRIVKAEGAITDTRTASWFRRARASRRSHRGKPRGPRGVAALTTVVPYNDAARWKKPSSASPARSRLSSWSRSPQTWDSCRRVPGYLAAARGDAAATGHSSSSTRSSPVSALAAGGAQELYGVSPDMTTLGKILGGGLPGGRLRRTARPDGEDGPGRPRLPGGDSFGEPARHGRRDRDAQGDRPPSAVRGARPQGRAPGGGARGGGRERSALAAGGQRSGPARSGPSFSPPAPVSDFASVTRSTRVASGSSFTRCCPGAFFLRRPTSRPGFSRPSTPRRISRAPPGRSGRVWGWRSVPPVSGRRSARPRKTRIAGLSASFASAPAGLLEGSSQRPLLGAEQEQGPGPARGRSPAGGDEAPPSRTTASTMAPPARQVQLTERTAAANSRLPHRHDSTRVPPRARPGHPPASRRGAEPPEGRPGGPGDLVGLRLDPGDGNPSQRSARPAISRAVSNSSATTSSAPSANRSGISFK